MRTTTTAAALLLCGGLAAPAQGIVRGERIEAAQAPWAVSVQSPGSGAAGSGHFCSGTAIGPRRVLTARHCTEVSWLHASVVMTGSDDPARRPGRRVAIARTWVPGTIPDDDAWPLREPGDVAVIETAADLGVPPLPLSRRGLDLPAGEPVAAYGFGRGSTVDAPENEPALLRRAAMRLYSAEECDEAEVAGQPWYLCAGPDPGPAGGLVAPGDSGGGLVRTGDAGLELVGVNATGTAGPLRDLVSGFASVAELRGFVERPERGVELPRPLGPARVTGRPRVGATLRCAARFAPRPERLAVMWVASKARAVRLLPAKGPRLRVDAGLRGWRVVCVPTGWTGDTNPVAVRPARRTEAIR